MTLPHLTEDEKKALAKRFADAPVWQDDDDPEGFIAVDISHQERDAIVAALQPAPGGEEWQDISTAPKDGSSILLTDDRTQDWFCVCHWDEEDSKDGFCWKVADASIAYHRSMFTHWKLLRSPSDIARASLTKGA